MTFSIDNHYELIALHRVMMEAKFSTDPNDLEIQISPLVATIANKVVDELINIEIRKDGEIARSRWEEWRKISSDRREYLIVKNKIKSEPLWTTWSLEEQILYVKNLVSPLKISVEQINELVNSLFK